MRNISLILGPGFPPFPLSTLPATSFQVQALARSLPYPKLDDAEYNDSTFDPLRNTARVANRVAIMVRGEKARLGLDQAVSSDVGGLAPGQATCGQLRLANGKVLAEVCRPWNADKSTSSPVNGHRGNEQQLNSDVCPRCKWVTLAGSPRLRAHTTASTGLWSWWTTAKRARSSTG